ncbi:MAG: DUF1330 domain-containing protein [Pseudomonadales bacterium]
MSRSLVTFLVFVSVLVVGFAVLAWWVGPAMVSLAFDEDRRTEPYYLVQLLDDADPAAYFQAFAPLLREEEGQLLWRGGLAALHAGRSRDEFGDMAILEFSTGASVVQMMTSSAYRALTSRSAPMLLGTPESPGPIAQDETLLVWLLHATDDADGQALAPLTATAAEFGGQLVWSTPVSVLEGSRPWNHLLLVAFPDSDAVSAWLADPRTATDRALRHRFYDAEAMLELRSG